MEIKLSKKDFESDNEVRWCPGCGDYAILASVQKTLAQLGVDKENTVFVSGIGCSSRFPYYLDVYGFHTIHGRAPTIATGLKLSRPDLSVWVITGDGDGLSIGANHLVHLMRRNVNVNVLLLNNRIYGLTKGQYSPTSELGKITKTSPEGSLDKPLCPIDMALAAGCGFVARAIDVDAKNLQWVLKQAAEHKGTSFVEIYQNCNVFNDNAFTQFSQINVRNQRTINLVPNEPLLFGLKQELGLTQNESGGFSVVKVDSEQDLDKVAVHPLNPSVSWCMGLNKLTYDNNDFHLPVPIGIFRQQQSSTYDEQFVDRYADFSSDRAELEKLLTTGTTWEVK